jgi:hypothetical protein
VTPSVGRIVHVVEDDRHLTCRAAIVTEVREGLGGRTEVGVAVLRPLGLSFNDDIDQDEENHSPGTWHWPERVE